MTKKSCDKDDFHPSRDAALLTVPSMAPMATLALYLHNSLKFSDKKQLLAKKPGIFVCFKMLLSVEMNKTLSPFQLPSSYDLGVICDM